MLLSNFLCAVIFVSVPTGGGPPTIVQFSTAEDLIASKLQGTPGFDGVGHSVDSGWSFVQKRPTVEAFSIIRPTTTTTDHPTTDHRPFDHRPPTIDHRPTISLSSNQSTARCQQRRTSSPLFDSDGELMSIDVTRGQFQLDNNSDGSLQNDNDDEDGFEDDRVANDRGGSLGVDHTFTQSASATTLVPGMNYHRAVPNYNDKDGGILTPTLAPKKLFAAAPALISHALSAAKRNATTNSSDEDSSVQSLPIGKAAGRRPRKDVKLSTDDVHSLKSLQQRVLKKQLANLVRESKLQKKKEIFMAKQEAACDEFRKAVMEYRMKMRGMEISGVPVQIPESMVSTFEQLGETS
jgi:hypothetical protein